MKTLKLISVCCLLLLGMVSCNKQQAAQEKAGFSIEVTNVTAINAKVQIDCKEKTPALVRYMAPVPQEIVAAEVDMNNSDAMASYVSKNGQAVEIPFSTVLIDLASETTYVLGVVAVNENMELYDCLVETFTTKDLASMFEEVLGDPSNAGNLSGNTLK